jgi:hypothetical protein
MRAALAAGLASTLGVTVHAGGFRIARSAGFRQAAPLASAGAASLAKPHAFVAMPFASELDDAFHYGIAGPVKAAGLLCERVDQAVFTASSSSASASASTARRVVIADLSMANPNVYLEVGYAWGRGRPTILLVRDSRSCASTSRARAASSTRASGISSSCSPELAAVTA